VHRHFSITVAPEATEQLLDDLAAIEGVISLSVRRGESVKPPGDVVDADVLNRAADDVLERVERCQEHGTLSIATSDVASLVDTEQSALVRRDVDESTWEDSDTAMRHHTRPTVNFYVTTVFGGVVAAVALVSSSRVTEATALVAAAIITPSFDPLARISLAVVMRRRDRLAEAIRATLATYLILVVTAVVTMAFLRAGSGHFAGEFLRDPTANEIQRPPAVDLVISGCGALTGVVMIAAGRFTLLAGPVVALQLMPAAATIGMGLELGDGGVALRGLGRLGIDVGFVVVAGLLYMSYKHVAVHHRRRTAL
jgi:uncharacterized membrane protein